MNPLWYYLAVRVKNETADKLDPLGILCNLLTKTIKFLAASETKFRKIFMNNFKYLGYI